MSARIITSARTNQVAPSVQALLALLPAQVGEQKAAPCTSRAACAGSECVNGATPTFAATDAKLLQELEKGSGVGNGVRTRDFRSHSPALYR